MKNIKFKIGYLLPVVLAFLCFAACEDTAETFEEFTQDGEQVYIGAPLDIFSEPGFKRLQFNVVINADPKISKGLLRSSLGDIEHEFDVTRTQAGQDTITFVVNDLPEGQFNLNFWLQDNNGNQSIPKDFRAVVLGESYQAGFVPRLPSASTATEGKVVIDWGAVPDGVLATVLTYNDADGNMQTITIANEDTQTEIESFVSGATYTVKSMFKPSPKALDEFETNAAELTFPLANVALGKPVTSSSVGDPAWGGGGLDNSVAVDGIAPQGWPTVTHTNDMVGEDSWLQIDLEEVVDITRIEVYNRQDCCQDRLQNYHIFISEVPFVGNSVAEIQAQDGVTDIYSQEQAGQPSKFLDINVRGRYVRIQQHENDGTALSVGEIEVY